MANFFPPVVSGPLGGAPSLLSGPIGANQQPSPSIPLASGTNVRQAQFPSNRLAGPVRNLIKWFLPEVGVVEMYINPQSISYSDKKLISEQRTRGGYVVQYWGEELTTIKINGTTGSSGIEGINVLRDVYRSEQIAIEPFALDLAGEQALAQGPFALTEDSSESGSTASLNEGVASMSDLVDAQTRPTLASLAFSVEMYYSGKIYRGFFTDFSVSESAEKIGLFDYDTTFKVTQERGWRNNFFAWHRSATEGPSDSDPEFGAPYTYSDLQVITGVSTQEIQDQEAAAEGLADVLQSDFQSSLTSSGPLLGR